MIKTTLGVLAILMIMNFPTTSHARDFTWQGFQVQINLGGEIPLIQNKLSLNGDYTLFMMPANEVNMHFIYLGPKWQVTESFWISSKIGTALNYPNQGNEAVDLSIWMSLAIADGKLTIFLEGDAILNANQQNYYGFYAMDVHLIEWFSFGVHAEQHNDLAMFGASIGFSHANWAITLRHFIGLLDENYGHTLRVITGLYF